jgi:cyclase
MPTDFVSDRLSLDLGDETLVMYNLGQAHTFNDLTVYLENRMLLFTGDLIFAGTNPYVKKESGTNVDKWLNCLDILLTRLRVITYVPGHGPSGGKAIVESMKQYFLDMKVAAADRSREPGLISKYKDWQSRPGMASPQVTIDFIRSASGSK